MRRSRIRSAGIVLALGLGLAVAGLAAGCGGSSAAAQAEPATAPHWVDTSALPAGGLRTLVVQVGAEPRPSEPGSSVLNAKLVEGRLPAAPEVATVLTDEDCAPDAQGISHCLNKLALADGSVLAVRHPHDMNFVPCLTPGEKVELRAA